MNIIFYHPEIIGSRISGSGLRPQKILDSLLRAKAQIFQIHGDTKTRQKQIDSIKLNIKNGLKIDFIYFENLSTPLTIRWKKISKINFPIPIFIDLKFLLFCVTRGIKVAYFYRDIHWKFDEVFEGVISKKRLLFLKIFGYLELLFLKMFIKKIYVPSENFATFMKEEFNLSCTPLPPGSDYEITNFNLRTDLPIRYLFVGGTGNLYNPKLLFEAFNEIDPRNGHLTYCTREKEWLSFKSKLPQLNNQTLKIMHSSGDKLKDLYNSSEIAVYSLPPIKYIQLTIAYKTAEYIAAGKPIIAYKGAGIEKIILDNDIGWIIPYDKNELISLINRLSLNKEEVINKRNNLLKIRSQFSWDKLVDKIIRDNS
jgi:glycosyltransferase involved in cell wall biosynthesis